MNGATADAGKQFAEFIDALAADIDSANKAGLKTIVVAGSRQPAEVHAAVAAINTKLQAPVEYYADPEDPRSENGWTTHADQLAAFATAAAGAGSILVIGSNPVLTAPASLKIVDVLKKVPSIYMGTHEDETAQATAWHVPQVHFLEAWGDVRTFNGAVSVAQPLIEPLFGARSTIEILSLLIGENKKGEDIVKETAGADYLKGRLTDWNWKKSLFDGMVENSARKAEAPVPGTGAAGVFGKLAGAIKAGENELALFAGALFDGRYANNGWLMEMPDPMTRVSWENPLIVSPKTAAKLGLVSDDIVLIKTAGNSNGVRAATYVLPGHPDNAFSIAVGYGRKGLGSVADGIGGDAWALRADGSFLISDVKLEPTGERPIVACVQDHHTIDAVGKKRMYSEIPELVVEGTFAQYKKKPGLGTRKLVALSIFDEHSYEKGQPWVMAKWGMAIDLTTCTGCSACVIACQAENNVPVVGKQMVYRGREMHWLRIDR